MTLIYNTSRQEAADQLSVSTRTIDRYIKKWQLSYKKVANKVVLAQEEIDALVEEFSSLKRNDATPTRERRVERVVSSSSNSNEIVTPKQSASTWSISEFAEILNSKDKTIEEKNQLIFMLQRKIGEVETKLTQMVALPDYTEETSQLHSTIQSLSTQKSTLEQQVKTERFWNTVFIVIIALAAIALWIVLFS